jgi:hypothetical protein
MVQDSRESDIDIARARFRVDGDYSDAAYLESFATKAFHEWQLIAYERIELDDFGLSLRVEEGSLKGTAKAVALASALYLGVGNYGDFRAGVKQIYEDCRSAAKYFLKTQVVQVELHRDPENWTSADAGVLTKVERLFQRVKYGELTPREGAVLALDILRPYGGLNDSLESEIVRSFEMMKRKGEQLSLDMDGDRAIETDQKPRPASKKAPRDMPPLPKEEHWVIDITQAGRGRRMEVNRNKRRK